MWLNLFILINYNQKCSQEKLFWTPLDGCFCKLFFRKFSTMFTYVRKYIHFLYILVGTDKYEQHIQPSSHTCHYILHLKRHHLFQYIKNQPEFTYSISTKETQEQCVKSIYFWHWHCWLLIYFARIFFTFKKLMLAG